MSSNEFATRSCRELVHIVSPLVRTALQKKVRYHAHLVQTADLLAFLELSQLGLVAMTGAVQSLQCLHTNNLSHETWGDPIKRYRNQLETYDQFFALSGAAMQDASHWREVAKRGTGHRAYWSACSHYLRGHRAVARELFKMALELDPATAVVPPVAQLMRYHHLFDRISGVLLGFIRPAKA